MAYKLIILSLALSIDAFGVGLACGGRGIKITPGAKLIISFQSIAITFLALVLGDFIRNILPAKLAGNIGTIMLILLGAWIIFQSKRPPKPKKSKTPENKKHIFFLKQFGLTIEIVRTPQSCDMDDSNSIDTLEAIYLGFSLSIDAFGAVTGAGIAGGYTVLLPFLVALLQILLLVLGTYFGNKIKNICPLRTDIWSTVSGVLLIAIGLIYMI